MTEDSNAEAVSGDRILDALGDSIARRTLRLGVDGPVTASEVAAAADVSRSAVYPRLNTLVDLGLVEKVSVADPANPGVGRYRTTATEFDVSLVGEAAPTVTPVESRVHHSLDVLREALDPSHVEFDRETGAVTVTVEPARVSGLLREYDW